MQARKLRALQATLRTSIANAETESLRCTSLGFLRLAGQAESRANALSDALALFEVRFKTAPWESACHRLLDPTSL